MATSNTSTPKPSKQTANRALRVVRLLHQLDKLALPITFLRAYTTVGIPYLKLAFLGVVLLQLQQTATFRQVLLLLGGFLLARYLLQLASNWFAKLATHTQTGVNRRLHRATTTKLLTDSYTTLQDPLMRNQYAGAVTGKAFSGGINSLILDGLQDFFSLDIALGFAVATLINLTQATNTAATWFKHARYPLYILALLLFPILVGSWSVTHSNQIQQQLLN